MSKPIPSHVRIVSFAIALSIVVCLAMAPAQAAQMYTLDDLGTEATRSGETVGFTFSLTEEMTVTDLGIFDSGGDGLGEEHQVGLWNTVGTLLASVTVPAGTAATLEGDFRFVGITPLALAAGQTYTLGAYYPTGIDTLRVNATISTAMGVIYGQDVVPDPPGFLKPSEPASFDNGFFGPNLRLTAVPEPGSVAVLGLGAVGAGMRRRRKAKVD